MESSSTKGLVALGLILAVGFVASAHLVSRTLLDVRALGDTITVTGSAKQAVTSDRVRWSSSFTRTVALASLKDGYAAMKKDEAAVRSFMESNKVPGEAIVVSPVLMSEVYKNDSYAPREYVLRQNVEVRTGDVPGTTALAKNLTDLVNQGVIFSSDNLEYTFSGLPELRVSLLDGAVKDAKERAEKIAGSAGQGIGKIRSAQMGVVQVLPPGSTDVSDYGTYDTASIEKEVMVTVKAVFGGN